MVQYTGGPARAAIGVGAPLKQLSLLAFILEMLKTGKAQFIIASPSDSSTIPKTISGICGKSYS